MLSFQRPHITAFCVAAVLLILGLSGMTLALPTIMQRSRSQLMALSSPQKDLGELLQHDAFEQADVLPVYGSSELVMAYTRVNVFFQDEPSGFRVSPVGRPGNSCLPIAEKLGALGNTVRGKKVAVILSAAWFKPHAEPPDYYAGNFSMLQAINLVLNDNLSQDLRHRLAKRMLCYPDSLASSPTLKYYLQRLALNHNPHEPNRWRMTGESVILQMVRRIYEWEDRLNTAMIALYPGSGSHELEPHPRKLQWPAPPSVHPVTPAASLTPEAEQKIASMERSTEWTDLELLLDTLKELNAHVLLLSLPYPIPVNDNPSVRAATTAAYNSRIQAMCALRNLRVIEWDDHDVDEGFFMEGTSHPSEQGWLYLEHVLDDFYHDRPFPKNSGAN